MGSSSLARRPARATLPSLLAGVVILVIASAWLYRTEVAGQVDERYRTVAAVGELKATEVEKWRRRLLEDVETAARNPAMVRALAARTAGAPDRAPLQDLLLFFTKNEEHAAAMVLLADGTSLEQAGAPNGPDAATGAAREQALRTGLPALSAPFRDAGGRVYVDAVAPLAGHPTPPGVLVHRTSVDQTLYPLLRGWPTPSPSAETLLVTADGDDVLFLSESRHVKGAELSMRRRRDDRALTSARAVRGERGRVSGLDYRGVEVIADLRPIPGSPWFLVSKVDRAEAVADARTRALVNGGLVLLLTGLVATLGGYEVRRRQAAFFERLYESERDRREAEERFRATLYSIGDGVLATGIDGRVREMNRAAEALTGWPEAEARGRPADEVFRLVAEGTREPRESPVALVLREGCAVEIGGDTLLVGRDGRERPVADSAAPIRDDTGQVTGVVVVFSDQSAARAARRHVEESEERLRLALQAADQGLFDLDVQTGEATVSREYATMLGHDPNTFRESNAEWIGRLHPDDRDAVAHTYREYVAGRLPEYRVEFRQRTADGRWKWILSIGRIVSRTADGQPVRMLGTHTDITARKAAEARIRRLAQLYATLSHCNSAIVRATREPELFGHVCDAAVEYGGMAMAWIGLVDESTGAVVPVASRGDRYGYLDGLQVSVDARQPQGRGPTGTAVREGVAQWCQDFVHDAATAPWHEAGARSGWRSSAALPLLRDGRPVGALTLYSGSPGAFDEEAQKLLTSMADDIGFALDAFARERARRRAEEETREARAQLEATLNAVPDLMFEVDLDGRFHDHRARSAQLLLLPPGQFLGQTVFDVLPPEAASIAVAALAEAFVRGWSTGATYALDMGGQRRWYELSVARKATPDGSPRFIVLARDVTQRKTAEAHRDRLENQLRQAQKMEAIGQLAGGVAHDFNNLLTIINGRADLALAHVPEDDPLFEDLADIRQAGERAASLTSQLLTFSRRQVVRPEVLDVPGTLLGMHGMLRRLISEDIRLELHVEGDTGGVRADPGQFQQVVLNLVINARDAMPRGGTLAIDARAVTFGPSAEPPPPLTQGAYVRLTISDSGVGMDASIRARIFEPFFTTKAPGHGTGLGLSTSYSIVSQGGGVIAVDSAPDAGSTFAVYLPRVELAPAAAEPQKGLHLVRGSETILFVDDEPALVGMGSRILTVAGYTVLTATDGEQALRALAAHDGHVDLLLTDVVIPGMSGRELAEQVVARSPATKVLYSSGYTDDAVLLRGVASKHTHFIGKPYSITDLTRKVREVLDS